jgi:hypothetical protein
MVRRNTGWLDQAPMVRARTGVLMVLGAYLAYWGNGVFNAGWALTGIPRSVQEWPRAISTVLQTWGTSALLLAGSARACLGTRSASWASWSITLAAPSLDLLLAQDLGADRPEQLQ